MQRRNEHFETTRVELRPDDTATDFGLSGDGVVQPAHVGSMRLKANYEALIRDRAIYYPIAYRFLRELGRGRQGVVFLGMRQGSRGCLTRHAIKIFDPGIYPNAKKYWTDMGRMAAQISELHSVHSPNLVDRDVYEENNGIGYIQMEAVDGIDLKQFLDGAHLEKARKRCTAAEWARFTDVIFRLENGKVAIQPGIALHIMRQILRGLEALHTRGFIHSDVKPANIMIDRLGYVKLVDFGRAVRTNERMSILLGSPLYMAPETHRRLPSLPQSDLFSAGLVGLELLRGEPFVDTTGMTELDLLAVKEGLGKQLHELLPPHVRQNREFVELLRRFIESDPKNRYPSAESAESGNEGLRLVHKQLTQLGKDTQYERELEKYLSKVLDHNESALAYPGMLGGDSPPAT